MSEFSERRRMMVDTQIRPSDVTKYPIIDALLTVERESFVPDTLRDVAYSGQNLNLGDGRVLLDPRTLAKMLDAANVTGDEMVLDIGCGQGYSSAVVARMAQAVIGVEEEEQASEAQALLSDAGADNVFVHGGPLADGAAEHGPYDVILIQGGVETLPDTLISQLKEGGRLVGLFMEGATGSVRIGYKRDGRMNWRFEFNAGAPVLPGFAKQPVFAL